ncbi:hypothetical protein KFK09_015704 [Dendrobium nobile]|uniref:Uncharacterized protein n=1 Tax=Dendrobium nobile TaxID=94219 RepID=A0A8T3B6S7_DENNO|nr:hypothetical protein KFK09_015704 [Dendrobium nobile]
MIKTEHKNIKDSNLLRIDQEITQIKLFLLIFKQSKTRYKLIHYSRGESSLPQFLTATRNPKPHNNCHRNSKHNIKIPTHHILLSYKAQILLINAPYYISYRVSFQSLFSYTYR